MLVAIHYDPICSPPQDEVSICNLHLGLEFCKSCRGHWFREDVRQLVLCGDMIILQFACLDLLPNKAIVHGDVFHS